MSISKETVLEKLRTIKGPDFEGDIVSLGLVSEIFIPDSKVFFSITVPAARPTVEALYDSWRKAYGASPFVQLLASGDTPDTAHVVGSNRVDMSAVLDPRTGNFVITSAEDNLVKGASGQAIQIMNLWCGFEETDGLL